VDHGQVGYYGIVHVLPEQRCAAEDVELYSVGTAGCQYRVRRLLRPSQAFFFFLIVPV